MRSPPLISVIIPTLNEEADIRTTLENVSCGSDIEIIIVDGGSRDKTLEVASSFGVKVLSSSKGRAGQMNTGAQAALGEVLLFLHADTCLPPGFADYVRRTISLPGVSAGAFRLSLTPPLPGLKLIERLANWRSKILQMPYGDQAIFVKTRLFKDLGGFSEMPIMEDLDLVKRLRRQGRIAIVPVPSGLLGQALATGRGMENDPEKPGGFSRIFSGDRPGPIRELVTINQEKNCLVRYLLIIINTFEIKIAERKETECLR